MTKYIFFNLFLFRSGDFQHLRVCVCVHFAFSLSWPANLQSTANLAHFQKKFDPCLRRSH